MNSLDPNEKMIQTAFSQIKVDTNSLKENIMQQRNNIPPQNLPLSTPRFGRRVVAALFAMFLLLSGTIVAAKLGSFGWLMETFNPRYREVVEPVEAFCEDNNIRLEIIAAQKYENTAVVYLSLQDTSGQKRLTEKSDFSDTLKVATVSPQKTSSSKDEVISSFSVSKKLLFFDTENNKLYYEFYINADGDSPLADELQIGAKIINFDYRPYEGEIQLKSRKPEETSPIRLDGKYILSASWSDKNPGDELLALPLASPEKLTEERDDVQISNIGMINDKLHLQIVTPFQDEFGSKYRSFDLIDPQGNKIEEEYRFSFVSDKQGSLCSLEKGSLDKAVNRHDEYVFTIDPEKASSYTIHYSFDAITGIEGEWKVAANLADSSKQMKYLTTVDNIDDHVFNTIIISPLGLEVHGTYEGKECTASEMKLLLETTSGQITLPSGYGSSQNQHFYYHWKFDKVVPVEEVKAILINNHRIPVK